ncbi:hypothetical protein QBC46DRAFT_277732 [Diplogelasinospora grovesii]|uniref:ATP-dependent bile acid permease n=1 Tax=Diplogelasinospora grovesii TaxID=303347 RepID=A0AAN6S9C8_9PEZI|nr:hypothetical protein QBC46DRAFT_277732 [Diplogelasinospora grovesii]
MLEQDVLDEIFGLAAILVVGLLTAPAIGRTLRECSVIRRGGYSPVNTNSEDGPGLYEDEDGEANEESIKAYSDMRPRIALWLSVLVGLGATVATRVLTFSHNESLKGGNRSTLLSDVVSWADLASWTLVLVQCACLPIRNHYLAKFRQAVLGLLSSLSLAISLAVRHGFDAIASLSEPGRDQQEKVVGMLCLVQLAAAVATCCAFAAFPRRPDVYDRDRLVDQQHTLSLLSLFSYSWNSMVFDIAKERQMQIGDMPSPDFATRSRNLESKFEARRGKGGPLWWQLIRAYANELALQWILTLVIAFLSLFPQVVLYNFLSRIETRQDYTSTDPALFVWVLGLLLSQLLQVGVSNWLRWITASRLEIPVGSLVQSLVFSKALKQHETAAPGHKEDKGEANGKRGRDATQEGVGSKDRKAGRGGGKEKETRQSVINHMKLDSARVTIFCMYNNNFPMALFKLAFAGGFLVRLMGWTPVLSGLGAAALMVPLSTLMSKKYSSLHFSLMKYRDGKAHLLTEALQGMRQIRYSALEQHWEDKILASRNEELRQYWRVAIWQCLLVFIVNMGPLLLASVAFSVYVWENGTHIRASVIFTSLGLFDQLDEAVALLPLLQMYLVEAWTSAVRLEKYFNQADKAPVSKRGDSVSFGDATVAWPKVEDAEKAQPDATEQAREAHSMLRDITLDFPSGELSVITGKTGSGKSLLLAAILGEVELLAGTVRVPTPPPADNASPRHITESDWIIPQLKAFVSQTPWIEGGTVKENIVFGLPFVEERYRKVLHACALEKDIGLLVDGDQTEVGPKGVTLSGGQRWRTALARALYSRAGIIILDDVLSAVDAHVGRLIVDEALTGELAQGRTRILATHHAELVLPRASYLVRLCEGALESVECLSPPQATTAIPAADGAEAAGSSLASGAASPRAQNGHNGHSAMEKKDKKTSSQDEEQREFGRVKWKVYKAYYKASGGALSWIFGIAILLLGHFLSVARAWSLKELSQQATTEATPLPSSIAYTAAASQIYISAPDFTAGQGSGRGIAFWMAAYVTIYFLISLVQVLRVMTFFFVGMKAARVLFQQMTHAILRAPLRWIDTVPAGRILNRFTSDTFTVDRRLANQTFTFLRSVLFLAIIIGTSLSVSFYVIFFGVLLFTLYAHIARAYIDAAREVKRINSISHSPIYDQFSSVLSGLSTIRAFGRTQFYMDRMYDLIDNSSKATWALQLCNRWMGIRMGMLGAVFVSIVANAVALGGVDAALAGFSLAFALRYTNALTSLLQAMTSVELGFNACERVLEYAEIETEPEEGKDAPAAWPSEGRIEVENLTVAYAKDLPPVLKNLNFTIEAGERIGIVGRTGAGKSSLAAVLFRLLDPREGSVRIDNLDISTLRLTQLRKRLAIIPQDPFLFSGTLRSNLDMEGLLDDYDLQASLQRVHLVEPTGDPDRPTTYPVAAAAANEIPIVTTDHDHPTTTTTTTPSSPKTDKTNIFTDLSTPVSTGGANLSQGQRQLVCLARALLTRPKIVVLDEATSAVDRGTDSAIQASLRKEFAAAGCTVLVIAHRLSTVADFDRLLVLDKGRVAEIGSPRELLEAGMAKAAGNKEEEVGGSGSGSSTTTEGGEGENMEEEEEEKDGTGAFWELVQKSAEKDKLIEMILGEKTRGE